MRAAGLDTSKQVSPVLLPGRAHLFARQTGILLEVCVRACDTKAGHGSSKKKKEERGSAWSLNPNGRPVLLHYVPLERTTRDERAEHDAHLLNPPGRTLNRPRRLGGGH